MERLKLETLILGMLAEAPGHGYAILRRLRDRSGGYFEHPEGSLYPALHRLEAAGLVASEWQEAEGRPRRTYRVTSRGRSLLASERVEWRRLVAAVERTMGWA